MANVSLENDEKLLKEGGCNFLKEKAFKQGHIFLTDKRIVIHRTSQLGAMMFGLFYLLLAKGNFEFDILLNKVSKISKYKKGLNKNLTLITTKDNNEFVLAIPFTKWIDIFKDTLLVYQKKNIIAEGENIWKVQS